MFLRLRHSRPDLFGSLASDVVADFVQRLIARCEAYIAFGDVPDSAMPHDAIDEAMAGELLANLAERTNWRASTVQAWQMALGFFFLRPAVDAVTTGGGMNRRDGAPLRL